MMQTLDELAIECGTDKSSRFHGYTLFYGKLLEPLRDRPVTILEVGVDGGESIRMWDRYFTHPETRIYGVDVHDKGGVPGNDRVKFVLGDATQPNFIFDLVNLTGPFDLVVEDSSHYSTDQKKTLELLWPHVKPGGLWITEDLHTSYHYPWTKPEDESFVKYLGGWIDKLHERGADHRGVPTETDIEEIVFRKSLVVLKKRPIQ